MRPDISIITVTRNLITAGRDEAFLSAIDCVQAQTHSNLEHVIMDGASDDGTQNLIECVLSADRSRTKAVPIAYRSEPDVGLYDAMNKAFRLARGRYVVFLNADDGLASPTVMRDVVKAIRKGAPDFVYGLTVQLKPNGTQQISPRGNPSAFLQRMPFAHNALVIRRDVFADLGGHDLRFRVGSDYDLAVRMLMKGYQGAFVPVPIAMFSSAGVAGNHMAIAQDYARVWQERYAPYIAGTPCEAELIDWYHRGRLPLSVCWAMMRDVTLPKHVRRAARYSFGATLWRKAWPWRRWDAVDAENV